MLLDYSLSGTNAVEFLKGLRESAITVPSFLIVTGRGDETIAVEAMKSGESDYITKKYDFLGNLLPAAGPDAARDFRANRCFGGHSGGAAGTAYGRAVQRGLAISSSTLASTVSGTTILGK